MGNRINALEIDGGQFSDIPIDRGDPAVFVAAKSAIFVEFGIDAYHFMIGRLQPLNEGAANVAPMPRYQDPHLFTPKFSREPSPGSTVRRATASRARCPCIARTSCDDRRRAACRQQAAP